MYNDFLFYPCFFLPPNCQKPPTLYSVLNSIVNGEKEEEDYTKIKDLAKEGRTTIFNFDYPLSTNVSRETFETMILNKFLMRRIGFETVTAFQIQLNVKLNEIMPKYNKLFDSLENWDIFNDGDISIREGNDTKVSNNATTTTNNLNNTSTTTNNNTSDRRNSEMPQNEIDEVKDGNYMTNYNFDTNESTISDKTESVGNSNTETNGNDKNNYYEKITHSPSDKINILKEMQINIQSIYTLIFNELECLFYGLL